MNHLTQNTLKLAVAAALAGTSLNAAAIIDFTGGTSTIAKYAKENPTTLTTLSATGDTLSLKLPNLSNNYTVGGSNYYNIKVNLLNGAKFGATATPALYCDEGTAAGVKTFETTPSVGGVGVSNATFVVPTSTTLFGGGSCYVTGLIGSTAITLSGLNTKQVSALVEFKDGATPTTTGYKSDLVTFETALKPVFVSAGTKVVDVAQQTLAYTDGSSTGLLGTVFFGSVTASAGAIPNDAVGGTGVTGLKATVGSQALSTIYVDLTVTGTPIAGASKVTLDTTSACSSPMASATPSGQVVTFTAGMIGDWQGGIAAPGTATYVCLNHDGATSINAGKVTACFDFNSEATTVNLQLPKCGSLREVQKNGKTFYGYVIPKAGGRDKAFFRFYNKSTTAGNIRVTLYGQDGNMIGSQGVVVVEAASFNPDQVAIVTVDEILNATNGITVGSATGAEFTGRAHAVFDIELPEVEMIATMKNTADAASPLTNFSTEAVNH